MDRITTGILDILSEGIYYVDMEKKITLWNSAAESITGFTKEDVIGKRCADNILRHVDEQGIDLCMNGCPLDIAISDGGVKEKVIYLHHKDGHRVSVITRVCPLYNDAGKIVGAVELFSDTSKRVDIIAELEKLKKEIYSDALTGVGNRKLANEILAQKMHDFEYHHLPFALYFIDVDNFKAVNDNYGHSVGDKVLKMVSASIMTALRPLDSVCRWGGEEFIVIVPNITEKVMSEIGERMRMLIGKSWIMEDNVKISVTASIGCSLVINGDTEDAIIKRADDAMYCSKKTGKNRVTAY